MHLPPGTGRDPGVTCHCPEFPGALPVLTSLLSRASTPSRGQMAKKPAIRAHFHTGQLPQAHAAPRRLLPTPCPRRLGPQLGLSIKADGSVALPSCPRVASRPTPPTLRPVSSCGTATVYPHLVQPATRTAPWPLMMGPESRPGVTCQAQHEGSLPSCFSKDSGLGPHGGFRGSGKS